MPESCAQGPDGSIQGLHDEFRHLLSLLILACAYNSDGVPILSAPLHDITSQDDDVAFRKLTSRGILSAIATIFVRDHEIFAVTDVTPTNIVSTVFRDMRLEDGSTIPGPYFTSLKNARKDDKPNARKDDKPNARKDDKPNTREDDKPTDSNAATYGLVRDGVAVDLWTDRSENDFWNHLLDRAFNGGGITDHVATVTSFMTNYVCTVRNNNVHDRAVLVKRFMQYIIAVCSQKMSSRASHWASIGMLRNLSSLPSDKVSELFSQFDGDCMQEAKRRHQKRDDNSLSAQLINLQDHLIIIYQEHPFLRTNASFNNLILTAQSNPSSLYNKDTCAEFHNLLISVLFVYAEHLHMKTSTQEAKLDRVQGIFFYLHLLWEIQESQAFRLHLDCISNCLEPIRLSSSSEYQSFAEVAGLKFRMPTGMVKRTRSTAVDAKAVEADAAEAEDYDDQDDGDDAGSLQTSLRFRAIISKMVAYVGATRMLQRYCTTFSKMSNTTTFHASIISTVYPEQATISWTGIQDALNKIKLENISMDKMKETLSGIAESTVTPHFSLGLFRKLANDPDSAAINYPNSTVHCEALLAALICYSPQDQCSGDLLKLIQASNALETKTIAVSKLCCPVCWELLLILDNKPSVTRGRHSTLYFQHLPSWLPREVLDKMLERFRKFAAVELQRAYKKYNGPLKSHAQNLSEETAYAVSIASSKLDEDAFFSMGSSGLYSPNGTQRRQAKEEKKDTFFQFMAGIWSLATNAVNLLSTK